MKICVVGTGGVGGYFGARLHQAGYDVTFMARGEHLKAMKDTGLILKSINGDYHAHKVSVTDKPKGYFDVVLVAVKTWQMEGVGELIASITGETSIILPLENGIESYEILSSYLTNSTLLAGLCRIFSWIEAPGIINHSAYDPAITFGEWDNSFSNALHTISEIFQKADIKYKVAEDIQLEIWKKFIFISTASAIGAVTRATFGQFRTIERTRRLIKAMLQEMVEVGECAGVALSHEHVESTLLFIDNMPEDATTSMQRDIMAGRPSELHNLIGAVVKLGEQLQVSTPSCAAVYASLIPMENTVRGNSV